MSDTTPNRKHQASQADTMTPEDFWRDLCEKDDRTSPEDYPDMALVTQNELVYMLTAYGDQRAREARAAAIEEAAKTYRYIIAQCGIPDPDEACRQILATCLRALTDVPPRPEGGEG
jgi:hypothetical protein